MQNNPYVMMPFWFKRVINEKLLMVNESGEYHFISTEDFNTLISYNLSKSSQILQDLKSKHFISGNNKDFTLDMVATKYRTRKRYLSNFSSLHMMVVTLRCNHRCEYCQVSSEDQNAHMYDMSPSVAERVVDYIFKSPSPTIKIEFQGGEPLINWSTITATVECAEKLNKHIGKNLDFVICTNLTLIDREKLKYLKDHQIKVSTSLDGPQEIHDIHRKLRIGTSSHALFREKLDLTQKEIGKDQVDALMTFTRGTIGKIKSVIDEYLKMGFPGIFIRSINPYGFAAENVSRLGYPMEAFLLGYKEALDYIIELNMAGKRFVEYYTALLLTRILTPFSTGFVDLQSPSGAGISGVIYDYNGDVYPADEGRMLARMGDNRFLMGNVFKQSYEDIFTGKIIQELVEKSCLEILPGCSSCAYRPYCGADPIRNYLEFGDLMGRRPGSPFCIKHMGIFDIIFDILDKNDRHVIDIFWSWITNRDLKEVQIA